MFGLLHRLGLANCVDCFSRNEQFFFNTVKVLTELVGRSFAF